MDVFHCVKITRKIHFFELIELKEFKDNLLVVMKDDRELFEGTEDGTGWFRGDGSFKESTDGSGELKMVSG